MKDHEDAYGRLILDYLEGDPAPEIVERDDGFINASRFGPDFYFAPFRRWPKTQRSASRLVRGRVLDIGCGAGRVAIELQRRGHEVVGIDVSPLAVEVARRRGAKDVRQLAVTRVGPGLGHFDTIVMFGNNCGLLGNHRRGPWLLRRFRSVTRPGARILAESTDPYTTDKPEHLAPSTSATAAAAGWRANCESAFGTVSTGRRGSTTCSPHRRSWPGSRAAPAGS